MDDRELLELAAKAAGESTIGRPDDINDWAWNPLTDDGDALRLLNRLGLQLRFVSIDPIEIGEGRTVVELQWVPGGIKNRVTKVVEVGEDPDPIVRRAIVRAAAAIAQQEGRT